MDASIMAAAGLAAITTGALLVTLAADLARVHRPLRYWLTM